ncbi:hypothetical protein BDV25DRAFT_138514 [Aspergillus avenaceus]|uniref:Uncharacterized protein n=1 Tax=Aspergillus avenaceus TaxID=36643 RepID=A0A5N6TZM4_ASPAV|nr:hypothetical protein BDV25DRAFT_138514 [Aspergillus avenaceus]
MSRTKEESTEIGMTVSSGSEVSNSVSASAGFSGFGFSAEVSGTHESRTFNSVETSTLRTVTDTYTCPPRSSIFVYKRRYKFRCRAWFFYESKNAWCEEKKGKIEGEFINEITANQELISPVALTGEGKITNTPPDGLARPTTGYNLETSGSISDLTMLVLIQATYAWA